ncbi:hypothetical protein ACFP6A_06030 [Quadrisphaera sp. GCM10027208]|uniref:hypothetical protein n=1 Tax=Quadrisphaera sp. GCM10027208 TaxID=3273423 RepID=UPI003621C031
MPPAYKSALPMVTWRAEACRCRLLTVYLTPAGWVLDGEDFRIPVPAWLERITAAGQLPDGLAGTLDEYRAGRFAAFTPGRVAGVHETLDVDPETWPATRFEVGCRHGHGYVDLADVAADCSQVRATRRPLPDPARRLVW